MPNGDVTLGGGATGLDPVVPTLSKITTYSDVVSLVRLLSHTSGNTTAITNAELLSIVIDQVGQIAKENWERMQPFYLQTATFNVQGSSNLYRSNYSTLQPYVDKFIGIMFLRGNLRTPIRMVGADELQRYSKLTTNNANSVFGTLFDGYVELFFGSGISNPQDYNTEIYYYRQPQLSGITTSNYSSKYVDLPDSYIPELVDKAVQFVERTKQ